MQEIIHAQTFGEYFKQLLKQGVGNPSNKRWTQQQFAQSIGRHVDTISNWIRGKTVPNDFDMNCIGKLLFTNHLESEHWFALQQLRTEFMRSKKLKGEPVRKQQPDLAAYQAAYTLEEIHAAILFLRSRDQQLIAENNG